MFCLCPPGDDPARKAVFDSILSGCIPVIFELNTLYNQYPWNLGEQNARDISVYIPGGQIRSHKVKFMDVLKGISPDVIKKKQGKLWGDNGNKKWIFSSSADSPFILEHFFPIIALIAKLAPKMQYSVPPVKLLEDKYDQTPWDPPFEDGVDAILGQYSLIHIMFVFVRVWFFCNCEFECECVSACE